jgi:hypothetical protein
MRYMIIVKANADSEAGVMPSSEAIAAMGRFNEELINAGVLLGAEGLAASSQGAKVQFKGGKATVVDGPFAEAKEMIAGFWIIQVKSRDEAIAWARKAPMGDGEELEVRRAHDPSDFAEDSVSEEHLRKEREWRDANQKPISN